MTGVWAGTGGGCEIDPQQAAAGLRAAHGAFPDATELTNGPLACGAVSADQDLARPGGFSNVSYRYGGENPTALEDAGVRRPGRSSRYRPTNLTKNVTWPRQMRRAVETAWR